MGKRRRQWCIACTSWLFLVFCSATLQQRKWWHDIFRVIVFFWLQHHLMQRQGWQWWHITCALLSFLVDIAQFHGKKDNDARFPTSSLLLFFCCKFHSMRRRWQGWCVGCALSSIFFCYSATLRWRGWQCEISCVIIFFLVAMPFSVKRKTMIIASLLLCFLWFFFFRCVLQGQQPQAIMMRVITFIVVYFFTCYL